jgi:hypothetical protein
VIRPDLSDDDVLIALLRDSLDEVDPVPEGAIGFAKAVARMSGVDAELATLVADSLVDDVVLFRHDIAAEAPGDPADRLVTFATPQFSVDMDLQADGATVIGAITPAISVEVDLETTQETLTTRSDELGRFQLVAAGRLCRLRIHTADGSVVTPWITR